MKKVFALLAAVVMLAGVSFAQQGMIRRHVPTQKHERIVPVMHVSNTMSMPKTAGDTINTFPWSEGFEGTTAAGFSFVDADGDGNNWVFGAAPSMNVHGGSGCIYSASWLDGTVLTPNNWMILPAFEMPADASEFNLSWFARGQDPDYANEHYSVYVCTTGNTPADFTATTPVYDGTSTDEYVKYSVDLSTYGGQTIFIAFRHWNSTDVFYLNIDDIRVGGAELPEISIAGPTALIAGDTATFTASSSVSSVVWNITADYTDFNGNTATAVWNTPGSYTVIASATNSAGTANATHQVNVVSCDAVTTFPWIEDFEDASTLLCWSTVDADNDGYNWDFNYLRDQGRGHNESNGMVASASYANQQALTPDNWMILPAFTIPANEEFVLSWYAKAQDAEYADENYSVYVSTTGRNVADFTTAVFTGMPTGVWGKKIIDLSSYAGQTIYVAFRHYNCTDMFLLDIDDIRIGVQEAPEVVVEGPEEARMNESVTFTATSDVATLVWTVDGVDLTETGATLAYTFTTDGDHVVKATATNAVGSTSDSLTISITNCGEAIALPHSFDLEAEFNLCWDNPEEGWFVADLEGTSYLVSQSNLYGMFDLDPDNWIYTPIMAMPEGGGYVVAWKVMPYTPEMPSDHYGVYVVQGSDATLLYEETLSSNITAPSQRSAMIPETVTGDFKIAFRHYETTGGYYILINDIQVVADGVIVGVDDVDDANVSIYPNPVSSMLRVEGQGIEQVEIIDVNGRVVMNTKGGDINVSDLADGIYMVRVVSESGVSTQKIVKK